MTVYDATTESRVLILGATARDAEITSSLLARGGLESLVCRDLHALAAEVELGASAAIVTEEIVVSSGINELLAAIAHQPAWSDLPLVMSVKRGLESPDADRIMAGLGNVTLIERPAPMRSVLSAVQSAVRARARQYQIRDQIAEIQRLLTSEHNARAAAEHAGRMKDEFLATLSHELRTPLTAVLGWTRVLKSRGRQDNELENGLSVIERNARLQSQLIEDLLDVSRIISGKLRLEVQQVDFARITDEAIESVRPGAEAKGIGLRKVIAAEIGTVCGDGARLQQIVWNLLSNAVKFTSKGGSVDITLGRGRNNIISLSVSDTGAGIKPEFLPHVFERFSQADGSTTRSHGGLGLGLAIVKSLVELHGGTVCVESSGEDQGATFVVELPLMAVPGSPFDTGSTQNGDPGLARDSIDASLALSGVRILVVDDDQDGRQLIAHLLRQSDASVVLASTAASALKIVSEERPTVIVSDIAMPLEDGYQFIQKVRQLSDEEGGNTPAVALTAFAASGDRARALDAGYQAHVSKPVEPEELLSIVTKLAAMGGVTTRKRRPTPPRPCPDHAG